jgi:hypothetical protein
MYYVPWLQPVHGCCSRAPLFPPHTVTAAPTASPAPAQGPSPSASACEGVAHALQSQTKK